MLGLTVNRGSVWRSRGDGKPRLVMNARLARMHRPDIVHALTAELTCIMMDAGVRMRRSFRIAMMAVPVKTSAPS